ncbi:hypothetical protein BELL_0619g00090 [Botrytis elliptica]|uniref:Heterokaryon incompatibility domain-containing protein n=1 Tax=Botrytis elliptica TaxID=278938 RepID=A0A4Z1JQD2_9HELO|nr:hypothetical protein BELL_0619g00090 [Botrytis elliptica]
MSLAEKRSGVDGANDEIADLRGFGLELGAMESDAMGRLPSDAAGTDDVEVGGVCEAQERGNDEVLVEIDDADTNGDPKIDNGSNDDHATNDSGHDSGHDFDIKICTDEGREKASRGTEGHENAAETDVLDDSGDHNVSSGSNLDVDKLHDEALLGEHEESEEEESSEDWHPDSSGIASESNDSVVVRWPIKKVEGAKDSMESENEINTTTTEVLNPDLCKFCRVFFDTWSSVCEFFLENKGFHALSSAHYDTMSDLRASASGGCHLCALFLSILSFELRKYDFSAHEAGDNLPLDQFKPEDIVLLKKNEYDCKIHDEGEYDWNIVSTFRTIKDDQRQISTWTKIMLDHGSDSCYIDEKNGQNSCEELRLGATEESTGIVRAWIRECHLNHSACKQQEDIFVLPTRLIKIDSQEIRLCMSSNENCSEYATLSHCWGKTEVLRLQKDNLQDFLIKIPYDKLCKTFRDEIYIARVLGFSWLWIDSLCIVQGDPEDWSREASRMATVYGLSSLNIAATAAPDGTIGCLFDRDLRYTEKHKVEVKMDRQKQVYSIADDHLYINNIANAALTNRAWAFQERILAPRTLHFTESQLFWECRTNQACETFPGTLPENFSNHTLYLPKQELLSWSKIIQIYTHCSLTNESDRLIAIGGVARQHQKKNGDKYLAGLWQSRIREQMCWFTHGEHRQHPRENTGRAPSWSWAAVNNSVYFPGDTEVFHEAYIDVTKIDITLENTDDPFGGVKSGILTLRSRFMMIFGMEPRPNTANNYRGISFGKFPIRTSDIFWDHRDCGLESYSESILMLPIGVSLNFIKVLVLMLTNQENGKYERVGYFDLPSYSDGYESIRRAMNLTQDDEQFKELGLGDALPSEKDYISTDVDEDGITWYTISIV